MISLTEDPNPLETLLNSLLPVVSMVTMVYTKTEVRIKVPLSHHTYDSEGTI